MSIQNAESELLSELNRTIEYAKQKASLTLKKLHSDKKISSSISDLQVINNEISLALSQVYRDIAPSFQLIKESVKRQRENLEEALKKNTQEVLQQKLIKK